jgi:hypothetical protein
VKRRYELFGAMLACAAAVAGCSSGGGHTGGLPTSPVSTDALSPVQPSIPIQKHGLHPVRLLGAHVQGKLLSMPWELVGIRRGGKVLVVYFVSGDGVRPHGLNNIGFRVLETSQSVELIAVSRNDNPGPDEAASLARGYGEIILSKPLGTRRLLHAPTDWPPKLLMH